MSVQQQIDRINTEVSAQETLLDQALAAIADKAAGSGSGGTSEMQITTGTFTPTTQSLYSTPISITGLPFSPKFIAVLCTGAKSLNIYSASATRGIYALSYDGNAGSTVIAEQKAMSSYAVGIYTNVTFSDNGFTLAGIKETTYSKVIRYEYTYYAIG